MPSKMEQADQVYRATQKIILPLSRNLDSPSTKAKLANLRQSIDRPLSQAMDAWALIFKALPKEYLGREGEPNSVEKAVLLAVQTYAIHQQGKGKSVNLSEEEKKYSTDLGWSLRSIKGEEEDSPVDKRFNTMISASSFHELSFYLRQLVSLLKSKSDRQVDYPRLAKDLYLYLENIGNVVFSWAESYYSFEGTKEGDENNDK